MGKQVSIWPTKQLGLFAITHDDIKMLQALGISVLVRDPKSAANPIKEKS